jgi:predicted nucleotidyltransferase
MQITNFNSLAQRYQDAWTIASQVERLLIERFGVQRVAVFGSLLRPELFHAESDLDLAVWGLAEQEYAPACAAVEQLNPAFGIDLVDMANATDGLVQTIRISTATHTLAEQWATTMTPDNMAEKIGTQLTETNRTHALAARLRSELADVEQSVARAERLLSKARQSGDTDWLDGVALNLHSFYTSVEKIFEEIAKEIDGALPAGAEWHQKLLIQMAVELPGRRPAVIQRSTRECLDEYRRFRHTVRNLYTFNLRPTRLQELTIEVRTCFVELSFELANFCAFLEQP